MKKFNFVYILGLIGMVSCEEQPVVLPEFVPPTTEKVVLIEELTGVSCPNCPRGVAAIEEILDRFPGKVVTYGIHGTLQTKPKENSKYDFRNQDAIDLEESLKPFFGKPAAAIDRRLYAGELFVSTSAVDQWSSFVEQELANPQELILLVDTNYDEASRRVTINVGVTAVSDVEGPLQLHVAITESHLIDPQDNVNTTIQDFEHNHVLKELVTQLSGDDIGNGLTANNSVTREFTYTIPDEENGEWIPENMETVVYVTSTDRDGVVVQAASEHIL